MTNELNFDSVKRTRLIVCAALAALAVSAFWTVKDNEFVQYDDAKYLFNNEHVQAGLTLEGVKWAFTSDLASNWHPLTWISHMLDCQFFGLDPVRHHQVNLAIHIANAVLLFAILNLATGRLWPAAFVAAAFAIHPTHVESVAWAAERKDVLCGFFWMLTVLAYMHYARRPGVLRYILVAAAFALGLLSKPMIVTLPIVLLLMDFWPLARTSLGASTELQGVSAIAAPRRKISFLLIEKIPLLVMTAGSCVVTYVVQQRSGAMEMYVIEKTPLADCAANATVAFMIYIGKTFYPSRLAILYPFPLEGRPVWAVALSAAAIVFITTCAIRLYKRCPYLTFGWLWYLVTLVPVIGIVKVGAHAYADRYTYIPTIGLFVICAWAGTDLLRRRPKLQPALIAIAAVALSCFWVGTFWQVKHWRNTKTLFDRALAVTEDNFVIHVNLGVFMYDQSRWHDALRYFEKAVEIQPKCLEAYNNMANVYYFLKQPLKAIPYYEKSLELRPHEVAHCNLALLYQKSEKPEDAIRHFRKALEVKPDFAAAHRFLANALASAGDYAEAGEHYKEVLQIEGDSRDLLDTMAWLYAVCDDDSIRNGAVAVEYARRAGQLAGGKTNARSLDVLAAAYAADGDFAKASQTAQEALKAVKALGDNKLAAEIEKRLELYRDGKPYILPESGDTLSNSMFRWQEMEN